MSTGFGCGAHSGIKATPVASQAPLAAVDEIDYEVLDATELKGLAAAGTQSEDSTNSSDTDNSGTGDADKPGAADPSAGSDDSATADLGDAVDLEESANTRNAHESNTDDGDKSAGSEASATSRGVDDAGDAYAFEAFDGDSAEEADAPMSSSDEYSSPNQTD